MKHIIPCSISRPIPRQADINILGASALVSLLSGVIALLGGISALFKGMPVDGAGGGSDE